MNNFTDSVDQKQEKRPQYRRSLKRLSCTKRKVGKKVLVGMLGRN